MLRSKGRRARGPRGEDLGGKLRLKTSVVGHTNSAPTEGMETMAKVTREMVEKTGINVNELLELLVKNAAAELTTFYYYTILRVNLIGLDGEGIKEIAETARIEDRNHFE